MRLNKVRPSHRLKALLVPTVTRAAHSRFSVSSKVNKACDGVILPCQLPKMNKLIE